MELLLVYLWLKLDTIIFWAYAVSMFSFIFGICLPTMLLFTNGGYDNGKWADEWHKENGANWKARRKLVLKLFIPCALFALFVPSSKDTAILVASSVAIDVAKSPEGAKIGQLLRGKANEILDKEISKLSTQVVK